VLFAQKRSAQNTAIPTLDFVALFVQENGLAVASVILAGLLSKLWRLEETQRKGFARFFAGCVPCASTEPQKKQRTLGGCETTTGKGAG
jgi:hypothetical protein